MQVKLTARQRRIIREIINMQLEALRSILNNDMGEEEDISLYCLQNGVEEERLKRLTKSNIEDFEWVLNNPESLLDLSDTHMSTFKHILSNTKFKKSQRKAVGQVWRKLFVFDDLKLNLN